MFLRNIIYIKYDRIVAILPATMLLRVSVLCIFQNMIRSDCICQTKLSFATIFNQHFPFTCYSRNIDLLTCSSTSKYYFFSKNIDAWYLLLIRYEVILIRILQIQLPCYFFLIIALKYKHLNSPDMFNVGVF